MELNPRLTDESPSPQERLFTDSVRELAECGGLADIFDSFLTCKEVLPVDNLRCAAVIRDGMELYFDMKGITYKSPAIPKELNHEFIESAYEHSPWSSLRELFAGYKHRDKKQFPQDDQSFRRVVNIAMMIYFQSQNDNDGF